MKVKTGDTVVVLYDGLLDNGELFESSEASGPLEFTVGDGSVMAAFDAQVIGMGEGEIKTFRLPPDEAHGPSNPELIHTVDRAVLPGQESLSVGMILGLTIDHEGKKEQVPATVTSVTDNMVTVDFNHPLAGQPLNYQVTVQSIRPAVDK
ncbi:MAG: peptidylprolyl isomerase [Proteobacteria bacterium]|nr:peptidylprolyl isomerase [Desulfobulbaceae bacterium]MBU4152391.1 peptidylprolyl isomerase [Pseudomonadota bacterium]MDP2105571.1 peptidylprolyl isomerase [Desulfobulbaceae bacterium]